MKKRFILGCVLLLLLSSVMTTAYAYDDDDYYYDDYNYDDYDDYDYDDYDYDDDYSECDHDNYRSTYWYSSKKYHTYAEICEDCGETFYKYRETHDWGGWNTTKKATPYHKGVKTRKCYYCSAKQTKTLPKTKMTKSQKKAIKVVKKYLKAAKRYDYKAMNKCFASTKSSYGYPSNAYVKYFKKHNKKIRWKVVDVSGKGKSIKVKVKVTRPYFYTAFYNALNETYQWLWSNPYASQSAVENYFNNKAIAKIKSYSIKTTKTTVTFKMKKTKKGWKIKSKSRRIVDLAAGLANKALDDAERDFTDNW